MSAPAASLPAPLPARPGRFSALAGRPRRLSRWARRGMPGAGYLAGVAGAVFTLRVPGGADLPGALLGGAVPMVAAMAAAAYLPLLVSPLLEARPAWLRWPVMLAMLPGALGCVALGMFFLEWGPAGMAMPTLTLSATALQCLRLGRGTPA